MVDGLDPTISMASTEPQGHRALPIERVRFVNAQCDRFEAAWREGLQPQIEDYLCGEEPLERAFMLRELIALDVELRMEKGQGVELGEYVDRFSSSVDRPVVWAYLRQLRGERRERCPDRIGDYELIEEIGCGGMGVVYRARQISANRLVALKLMRSGPYATAQESRRFRLEGEAAANLDHPNIIPIFEVGTAGDQPYFTMKLVEGGNLAGHLSQFVGHPRSTASLLARIARAVDYAHRQGFLHRDLKPSNILLDTHLEPHLTDFGLVKRLPGLGLSEGCPGESESEPTRTGVIVGTPSFMAPEQAAGQRSRVGVHADVYSLGAILYTMLVGRPPFVAETVMETVVQVTEQEPVAPRKLRPDVPRALEWICLKCLEKSPQARYATAAELADDLDRYLRDEDVHASHIYPWGRLRRWIRREPDLAYRLVGIGSALILTQLNYFAFIPREDRIPAIHWWVTYMEALWLALVLLIVRMGRWRRLQSIVRPGLIVADMTMLSLLMHMLDAVESVFVLAYGVLIAAAGLWSRQRLVWLSTVAALVGYSLVWLDAYRGGRIVQSHYVDVVLAVFVVTGCVVSHQVRRVWALSQYYEQQVPPR